MTEITVLPSKICSHLFRVVISGVKWRVKLTVAPCPCSPYSKVHSLFTWILPQHQVTQSGCPVSLIPPPGRRSGASGAGCHSPPQTRHPCRPEGWWASWRSPWPLREKNDGRQSQMMSQILTGKSSGWSLYPSYCEVMQWDFSNLGHQLLDGQLIPCFNKIHSWRTSGRGFF